MQLKCKGLKGWKAHLFDLASFFLLSIRELRVLMRRRKILRAPDCPKKEPLGFSFLLALCLVVNQKPSAAVGI